MDSSILHTVLAFAAGAFEQYVGLLSIGLVVALVAVYVTLSERITALERQLRRELRHDRSAPQTTPPQAEQLAQASVTPAASVDPWGMPSDAGGIVTDPFAAAPAAQPDGRARTTGPPPPADGMPWAAPERGAQAAGLIERFLASGNWLVRSGIVVLFLGVGFLLKFAAEHSLLPLEFRLAAVGFAGIALVVLGLRLTASRRAYALAMQGGGVGLIYLTLYAAFALYALVSAGVAFSMMFFVVFVAGWLAHRQDAQVFAVMGAIGGFAAPVLASTGAGSHVLLFTYYAVLNVGVLGLALSNTWRVLNFTGFVATFVISGLWGYRFYNVAHFASVEPFLILFFVMYLSIAIAFATLRSVRLQDPMDSTLVFGTPLVVFGLQSRLVADTKYGLALTAALFALLYAGAAWLLLQRRIARLNVLAQAFTALAIGFMTLAIPLAFDARWSSASWALEGAALLWVGWRQHRRFARAAGALLQLIAGGTWLWHGLFMTSWHTGDWLGTLMLAIAGMLSSIVLCLPAHDETSADAPFLRTALGVWGLLWWFGGGTVQIQETASHASTLGVLLLFIAISALCLEWLATRLRWGLGRTAVCCLPALLVPLAVDSALRADHPLTAMAAVGWPFALCAFALILRLRGAQRSWLVDRAHLLSFWLASGLLSWEFAWQCARWLPAVERWRDAVWLVIPGASIACLLRAKRRALWPVAARNTLYLHAGAMPLLIALAIGVLFLSLRDPSAPWPIPYLPLLNPLDLLICTALAVMAMWWHVSCELSSVGTRRLSAIVGVGLAFVWLNGALLRTLYFWAAVPYELSAQMHSTLVQASLSVLWATTALFAMVAGSRTSQRGVWMSGVSLMVAVILKLLSIDLANSGTIARIVSFICVGLLLMLVGYLAPVPPRRREAPLA